MRSDSTKFENHCARVNQELAEKPNTGSVAEKGQCKHIWKEIWSSPKRRNEEAGIIANKISRRLESNKLLAAQQTGIMPGSRGTIEQLLIDKAVCADSMKRRTNLSLAWIDYQKAYDSVLHSWMSRAMEQHGVNIKKITLISEFMNRWNTQLTACGTRLSNIPIMSGIFQGDAVSPLIICVALSPLSSILSEATLGKKI